MIIFISDKLILKPTGNLFLMPFVFSCSQWVNILKCIEIRTFINAQRITIHLILENKLQYYNLYLSADV